VLLDDLRRAAPGIVGDLRTDLRRVVVLDGATPRRRADQLDQTERRELPDVVAHVRQRRAQLARDLARARDPIVEHSEDVDTQGVCVGLRDAGVSYVDRNSQFSSSILRTVT